MKVESIILGLLIIVSIFYLNKGETEGLEATCENKNVMNCAKICNRGSATLKCINGRQKCKIINNKGCRGNADGPTGLYDKCIDSTCKDDWFKNNLKNCSRKFCKKGCGDDYKKCVDKILPAKPTNSDKNTGGWKFVGPNQNCSTTTKRNYVGYINKKDGEFEDLIKTCNNSPGCGYITRDAKGGHGNLYKLCDTKAHSGMDVWKRPGGPSDIPPSHKHGGMITYEKMPNKTTYNGAGSKILKPSPWGMGVTVDQCKKFCDDNDDCDCIVYDKTKTGTICHLRKGPCDPKFFQDSKSSTVYIKKAAAPLERDRPKNMLKVGAGACRFGGIPNKGYVGKGYMSPKECLEACSINKKCYGADFHKIKKNGAECINFVNEKKPFNYNLWTEGGAKHSGYCYKKLPDRILNCKIQAGKYGCEKCEDNFELSKDKKKCTAVSPIPNCKDQYGNECNECSPGYEMTGEVDHYKLKHHREGFVEGHTPLRKVNKKDPICKKINKIKNCKTQKGSECQVCDTGYQLNDNKKCEESAGPIPNCKQQNGDLCNSCEDGFQLGGDKRSCVKGTGGSTLSSSPVKTQGGGAYGGGAHGGGANGGGAHGGGAHGGGAHGGGAHGGGAHGGGAHGGGAHGGGAHGGGAHGGGANINLGSIPNSKLASESQIVDPTIGQEPEGEAPDAFIAGTNAGAMAAAAAACDKKKSPDEEKIDGPACKIQAVRRSVPATPVPKDPVALPDTVPDTRAEDLPPRTCSWEGCCTKDKPPLPELGLMRPHKHKQNPKMLTALNNVNNYLQEWYEKIKPLPTKEQEEPDYKLIKEENAKLNEILARIKADEMKKKFKVKKRKAFPIDLDVVLNDEIDIQNDLKNRFLKPNMFQYKKDNQLTVSSLDKTSKKLDDLMKEGFISGRLPVQKNSYPGWGYGPKSVNKNKMVQLT